MTNINCCRNGDLIPEIDFSKIETLQNIDEAELKRISKSLSGEIDSPEDIPDMLELFFSLSDKDVETVLTDIRQRSYKAANQEDKSVVTFKRLDGKIADMVSRLNAHAMKVHNVPFHLAAARGDLKIDEGMEKEFQKLGAALYKEVREGDASDQKKLGWNCAEGNYWRYVSKMWPWKMQYAWSIRTRRRWQDVGCHFEHGPFKKPIKGYVTWSWRTLSMIYMQGWSGKLAANTYHLWYKWWFVAAMGLTPWALMWTLKTRRY